MMNGHTYWEQDVSSQLCIVFERLLCVVNGHVMRHAK
jgi:hypothetical protein